MLWSHETIYREYIEAISHMILCSVAIYVIAGIRDASVCKRYTEFMPYAQNISVEW